jgi:putative tricarboxylic transport membrane protein
VRDTATIERARVPLAPVRAAAARSRRRAVRGSTRVEAAVLAVIAAAAFFTGLQALRLGLGDGFEPGPGMFPLAVSVSTFALAAAALGALARGPRAADRPDPRSEGESRATLGSGPARRVAWYAASIVFWSCTLPWLGFSVSSALALVAILRGGERQRWRVALAFAAAAVLACRWVFEALLGVPLPRGAAGF